MHILARGSLLQRLRLGSGLVLFTFALTHFLNHALGLFSVDLMQEVQAWRWTVTRSYAGSAVLASALLIHIALALYKLAMRGTLKLPPWELVQLAFGLTIPFFLFPHIVNTRIAHTYFGVNDTYLYELARLWPGSALTQSFLLLLVWIHGCIGLHFWLRLYEPYRRAAPALLALAFAIPVAALSGFMVSGRGIATLIQDAGMFVTVKRMTNWPPDADQEALASLRTLVRAEFAVLLAAVAGYMGLMRLLRLTGPKVRISYVGGPSVVVPQGPSLLEISRACKVPHAAVCGGRARCSTCRVRIERGSGEIQPPVFPESVTLGAIQAAPNVRLACQLVPQSDLVVTRLMKAGSTGPDAASLAEADAGGVEKTLAVMFVDLRHFTRMSENRLPYDVVFILNEFFAAVGSAITMTGGRVDKFLGDGLLAVFGEVDGAEAGCRQALRTARTIDLALDEISAKLEPEVGRALEVGIGIDAGPLLIGRIGFGAAVDFTVIGTAVNVASRLEAQAKARGVQIVISAEVARLAGWAASGASKSSIEVRGVADPVEVIEIGRGRDLPAELFEGLVESEGRPVRRRWRL